jgi:hypothetical protein
MQNPPKMEKIPSFAFTKVNDKLQISKKAKYMINTK